jgi:hypothetical protein
VLAIPVAFIVAAWPGVERVAIRTRRFAIDRRTGMLEARDDGFACSRGAACRDAEPPPGHPGSPRP